MRGKGGEGPSHEAGEGDVQYIEGAALGVRRAAKTQDGRVFGVAKRGSESLGMQAARTKWVEMNNWGGGGLKRDSSWWA